MATKTLQELQAEQATIDASYSTAAGKWAAGEFDPEGVVTLLERAEQAESNAENSANAASTAAGLATTAKTNAETASGIAVSAKTNAETARGIAEEAKDAAVAAQTAAEQASTEAVTKVKGAAQVGESNEFTANNTFKATNTFNGALVANNSLTYESQELNNLLSYPIVAQLMAAGINPASALATTWADWVSMNPNWQSLDDLLFYAPLITEEIGKDLPTAGTPDNKSCTFISPAKTNNLGCAFIFRQHVKYFTWRDNSNSEVFDCYFIKDCDFYAPNATSLLTALNAIGFLNSGTALSLNVYVPNVTQIVYTTGIGTGATFYRIGLLKSFSIYAPKLKTSFNFSRRTNKLDADRYHIGQTCAILQALIDGIGEPDKTDPDTGLETEPQTITTLPPSDGDVVQTTDEGEKTNLEILNAAAAAKHWQFDFVPYQQPLPS